MRQIVKKCPDCDTWSCAPLLIFASKTFNRLMCWLCGRVVDRSGRRIKRLVLR